jgi:uncharacterized protein YcbX
MADSVGTIAALNRYPVKSMLGEGLTEAYVTQHGLLGDRTFALVDGESGRVASAKSPRKFGALFRCRATYIVPPTPDSGLPSVRISFPDGSEATTGEGDLNARLTRAVGRDVSLASAPPSGAKYESVPVGTVQEEAKEMTEYPLINGFFDLGAVHLLATGTLECLRELYPGGDFDARRFRPNILVSTPVRERGFLENAWIGKTLSIGNEVRLRVFSPTIRCVMTTLPQGDLPSDPGILKTAAKHNQANVGVYAMVVQPGTVRVGDEIHQM